MSVAATPLTPHVGVEITGMLGTQLVDRAVVVWDNTGMLHRALLFEPTSPRLMHRTTLVGVEPVA